MADSNITKRALAAALKELMEQMPFSKISVGNICEHCAMNRKSFYYHFRDKYDLVNWIFDTEFIGRARQKSYATCWDFTLELCSFLYENREFYRKALQIQGQNSFSEHFRDFLLPVLEEYLRPVFPPHKLHSFHVVFYGDAFLCAISRWILQRDCIPAIDFVAQLRSCFSGALPQPPAADRA